MARHPHQITEHLAECLALSDRFSTLDECKMHLGRNASQHYEEPEITAHRRAKMKQRLGGVGVLRRDCKIPFISERERDQARILGEVRRKLLEKRLSRMSQHNQRARRHHDRDQICTVTCIAYRKNVQQRFLAFFDHLVFMCVQLARDPMIARVPVISSCAKASTSHRQGPHHYINLNIEGPRS